MQTPDQQAIIAKAIATVTEAGPQPTRGRWLENLTVDIAPFIDDWNVAQCWHWTEWPEREDKQPHSTGQDIGIDAVALNRDGEYIAIQCKSRQLDQHGRGRSIDKPEIDSFASASSDDFWSERWIVTNGDNPLGRNAMSSVPKSRPIKLINIASDLVQQQTAFTEEDCTHCNPIEGEEPRQSRSCMQAEAIAKSVQILKKHERSESDGIPKGQARGKIILPCGTGKTRISLRIVEELTPPGELSIVLCPSIALVAQIRREYLQQAHTDIRALAVCSDETAGYDPEKESSRNTAEDPTLDNSNVSASEVKGKVTTNPAEIADWILQGQGAGQVDVIFGTYQSGSRIAEALGETGVTAKVLICDEAHRTAGLRRKGKPKAAQISEHEKRVRDFTLCHDNDAFPSTYRVYQTATPRIYDTRRVKRDRDSDWIVRSMDDLKTFGVELYRKSYVEAVENQWLADYRIIAVGVNGPKEYKIANTLAGQIKGKGRNRLNTSHFLRGLAFSLAMGGATQRQDEDADSVPIKSCIAFMNTVDKSRNMADALQTDAVREWLQGYLNEHLEGQTAARYTLKHLDATSNVTARDNAKRRLAEATEENPHGIVNVGIFGEGTDSPSLNAVAFLEPRRSPIDVIQAVGRAMRVADGKETGYIICPIVIPPDQDAEKHLSTVPPEEGWRELGQILLALRAHDQRIEDDLSKLLYLYIPKPPKSICSITAIATQGEGKRIHYSIHEGKPGDAEDAVERVLESESSLSKEFHPIPKDDQSVTPDQDKSAEDDSPPNTTPPEPTQIIAGKKNEDGSIVIRIAAVERAKPKAHEIRGEIDIRKTKVKGRKMINDDEGQRIPNREEREKRKRPTRAERAEISIQRRLIDMEDEGNAIKMNLLSKSGLVSDRVVRDLNILESSVMEAARYLREERLQPALDRHFMLDNLDAKAQKAIREGKAADGCVTAALLLMNAAMLHQRIANGRWLRGVSDLSAVKNDVNVIRRLRREWGHILTHDFRPVLEPAVGVIEVIEDTGKLTGLERALHHIAADAERIAETYADMGADHAGPLFNRVMGNQASDGAFFTRPPAASIAARLTLDACGKRDWTDPGVWRQHKTVDLACGSGTLLAAMLTDMKRRARDRCADEERVAELQKLAVEDVIKGLDINPVSLQLAAAQLTAGNQDIRYRRMGLHLMPYGPNPKDPKQISIGSLELLGQKAIVPRDDELALEDQPVGSQTVWNQPDDAELEDAVDAAKDARIVIMNPPFTNRAKMGEKFPKSTQETMRKRTDSLEAWAIAKNPKFKNFTSRNSVRPNFVMLADFLLQDDAGTLTMINPTIALSGPSGLDERRILAERFHIHTVLTCHQTSNINLSQNTNINESIVVLKRTSPPPQNTRFINLDRMPRDQDEVNDLHQALLNCKQGQIANGWGEVSYWPVERMVEGDWTPAIWRSPELAEAAARFANDDSMKTMRQESMAPMQTGRELFSAPYKQADIERPGSFPVIRSKSADGQTTIQSVPDGYWVDENNGLSSKILQKSGYLLITDGHDSKTARLTGVASDQQYVGVSWMPVPNATEAEAKAIAVFINSTPGRLQLMRNAGRKIAFPMYRPAGVSNIRIPNVADDRIRGILADCWERTKDMVVPQFRDGECEVRRLWDEAVAEAMGWDAGELARLRNLLHQEPHVRGLGYGQYSDAP